MTHVHGDPDNEEENLDSILGRGLGDPDVFGYPGQKPDHISWVGEDRAVIELSPDPIADWVTHPHNLWNDGDRMRDGSDEQGWDLEPKEPEDGVET